MEKKANKFVCALAKKLAVESQGCNQPSQQDLQKTVEDVIKTMPKKDPLKLELQGNLATYMKKLNRWMVQKQTSLEKQTKESPKKQTISGKRTKDSEKQQPSLGKQTKDDSNKKTTSEKHSKDSTKKKATLGKHSKGTAEKATLDKDFVEKAATIDKDKDSAKQKVTLGKHSKDSVEKKATLEKQTKDSSKEKTLGAHTKDSPKKQQKQDIHTDFAYNLFAHGGFQKALEYLEKSSHKAVLVPYLLREAHKANEDVGDRISEILLQNPQQKKSGASKRRSSVDDLIQLYRKEMMALMGNRKPKPLLLCLDRFQNKITPEVEDIIEKKDKERAKKLQEFFLDFLAFARFQFELLDQDQEACVPNYEDLMAVILALLIDLSIFLSRDQDNMSHCGKKALYRLQVVLGHAPLSMLYTVLQLSEPSNRDAEFMMPIYKKTLSKPASDTNKYYYAFVLASRQACNLLQEAYPSEASRIVQTCMSLDVPKDMMSWLSDAAPQAFEALPSSIKKNIHALTQFLLKDASEEMYEALLDAMSSPEEVNEEDEESSQEDEESHGLFFMDTSQSDKAIFSSMESESDTTQTFRKTVDTLVLGMGSDNKQEERSESSDSSSDDEEVVEVSPSPRRRVQKTRSQSENNASVKKSGKIREGVPEEHRNGENNESENDKDVHSERSRRKEIQQDQSDDDDDDEEEEEEEEETEGAEGQESEEEELEENEVEEGNIEEIVEDEQGEGSSEEGESSSDEEEDSGDDSETSLSTSVDEDANEKRESSSERKQAAGTLSKSTRSKEKSQTSSKNVKAIEKSSPKNVRRSARQVKKDVEDKENEAVSNEDDTFTTCVEDGDEKDIFFDADEEVTFKNKSPEKTPPMRGSVSKVRGDRSFMETPNTYLNSSRRKSSRLTLNGSKCDNNQTTLLKYFTPAKSMSEKDDNATRESDTSDSAEAIVIADSDESMSKTEKQKTSGSSPKGRSKDKKNEDFHTPKRSLKKLTPPPSLTKFSQVSTGHEANSKSKGKKSPAKTTSRTKPRHVPESDKDEVASGDDGLASPVFPMTSSQLSDIMPLSIDIVPESEEDDFRADKERQLEDVVIQGIRDIRKSLSPPQSPIRHSAKQDKSEAFAVQDKTKRITLPSVMVVKVDATLMDINCDAEKENNSAKTSVKKTPRAGLTPSKGKQRQTPLSLKRGKARMQDAATAVSPPSAKKAATDFGNTYRMMAGIGLSTDSEADKASSLEDFKVSPKKSQLHPRTLVREFESQGTTSGKKRDPGMTSKDDDKETSPGSPVRSLRSRTVSENAGASSPLKSSQSKKNISISTQVKGKPPIPSSSKKARSASQESGSSPASPRRSLRSRNVSETEQPRSQKSKDDDHSQASERAIRNLQFRGSESSARSDDSPPPSLPRTHRSKRNSECSQMSEQSIPPSPKRSQRIKRTSESSQVGDTQPSLRSRRGLREADSASQDIRMSPPASPSKSQPSKRTKSRDGSPPASPDRISRTRSKETLLDAASTSVLPSNIGFVRTLRSRTGSESSSQDSSGITATQVLRRDIDKRKLKNSRPTRVSDDEDEDEDAPKMKMTKRKGLLDVVKGRSEQKASFSPASNSKTTPRRKSSKRK